MKIVFILMTATLFFQTSYSAPPNNKTAKPNHSHAKEGSHAEDKVKLDDHHDEDDDHDGEKKDDHAKEKQGEHKDKHDEKPHGEAGHDEKGHNEEGHAEEAEENSQVGPDKGILAASAEDGFKLSPEALVNFEVKTLKIISKDSVELPENAVVYAGQEINIYRVRDGFFKRIDFTKMNQKGKNIIIKSPDLSTNDEVVIEGIGYLRLAELAAFGGAPEGHSH